MKARESFFFGMIPVLFPILSDRCRNSVVFFNYCFTDTHLTLPGVFWERGVPLPGICMEFNRNERGKPGREAMGASSRPRHS